jgi:NAD(P)-dependent dehydrogenase (short-subunit alcohol dehydrogenase family)
MTTNNKPWTLITGAAEGLGSAIALGLAKQGIAVVIHFRESEAHAIELVRACEQYAPADMLQGDFSSSQSIADFLNRYHEQFPNTLNLINNVGNMVTGSFVDTPVAVAESLFQTNLFAPIQIIHRLLPALKKNQGSIINIGTAGLPFHASDPYAAPYFSTKLALWGLTRSLAQELIPHRVRVNMVSPGFLENAIDLPQDPSLLPWGRPADFEEVVRAVEFLIDPQSSYITGQNLEIAGGVSL